MLPYLYFFMTNQFHSFKSVFLHISLLDKNRFEQMLTILLSYPLYIIINHNIL